MKASERRANVNRSHHIGMEVGRWGVFWSYRTSTTDNVDRSYEQCEVNVVKRRRVQKEMQERAKL